MQKQSQLFRKWSTREERLVFIDKIPETVHIDESEREKQILRDLFANMNKSLLEIRGYMRMVIKYYEEIEAVENDILFQRLFNVSLIIKNSLIPLSMSSQGIISKIAPNTENTISEDDHRMKILTNRIHNEEVNPDEENISEYFTFLIACIDNHINTINNNLRIIRESKVLKAIIGDIIDAAVLNDVERVPFPQIEKESENVKEKTSEIIIPILESEEAPKEEETKDEITPQEVITSNIEAHIKEWLQYFDDIYIKNPDFVKTIEDILLESITEYQILNSLNNTQCILEIMFENSGNQREIISKIKRSLRNRANTRRIEKMKRESEE